MKIPGPMRQAVLLGVILLAGCSDGPRLGETGAPMAVIRQDDLPAPDGSDLVAATTPYRIGPFDKLNIVVYGEEDLSAMVHTDALGVLSMPLIGRIDAAGKTPDELAAAIRQHLLEYVRDPHVAVNLEETTSHVFTVDGQVTEPGSYPVAGNMSLMRAIASAKGVSEFARMNDVVIFRTVGGRPMAGLYNLDAIRRGLYPDPKIYANDVIVVGDSKARRMFQEFLQITPLLTTPLILGLERF